MERQSIPFKLSPTVNTIYSKFADEEAIPSIYILRILKDLHPKYGQAKYPDLSSVSTSQNYSVNEWLLQASDHFNLERVDEFHGRLLIIGLSICDPELADILKENDFLSIVAAEIRESLDDILLVESLALWQQVVDPNISGSNTDEFVASDTIYTSDQVPILSDHPTFEDELGRRAFARSLARRIQRVQISEKWPEADHIAPFNRLVFVGDKICNFLVRTYQTIKGDRTEDLQKTTHSGAFMMHIHGPWGAGKTTLLNFIRDELEEKSGDKRWVSIYFNAWKYQRLGPPWWALTKEVYMQSLRALKAPGKATESDVSREKYIFYNEIWSRVFAGWGPWVFAGGLLLWAIPNDYVDFLGEIGKVFTLLGGVMAASRFVLTGSARGSSAIMEISGDPMGPLVEKFNQLILDVGHPVVIFIDDLDRCDAEYVIRVLHGIQTMYWGTQVAYVVAADRHWLRAAYENTYSEFSEYVGEPGRPIGYLFLEKLFQISAPVPQLDPDQIKKFWNNLIGISSDQIDAELKDFRIKAVDRLKSLKTEEEILTATQDLLEDKTTRSLYAQAFREESVVRMAEQDIEKHTEHSLRPFSSLLEPNPRAMKRMVNAYAVRRANDIIKGGNIDRATLALWIIIELRWPLLAEYLTENPADVENIRIGQPPSDESLDNEVKKLFNATEVLNVINGNSDEINAMLTEEDIVACTGHRPALPINGSMV